MAYLIKIKIKMIRILENEIKRMNRSVLTFHGIVLIRVRSCGSWVRGAEIKFYNLEIKLTLNWSHVPFILVF